METSTKIKELQSQVRQYDNDHILGSTFSLSIPQLYFIIPVVIFFILALWRPPFILEEKKGQPKFSPKKLLIYWIILSAVLNLGLYGFNYKMKTD